MGKSLTLLQVVGSSFNGPIYKGILPAISSLLPVANFPKMIYPTQIARPSQPVTYSFPITYIHQQMRTDMN